MLIEKLKNIDISYDLFISIIEAIEKNIKNENTIKQYCLKIKNNNIDFFDNHIYILEYLNIIDKNDNTYKLLGNGGKKVKEKNIFIKSFLNRLNNDGSLDELIDCKKIQEYNNELYISNSEIALIYSGLRNFFINNGVLEIVTNNINLYKINNRYKRYFIIEKGLSLNQLNNILQKQKEQGEIAEEFVLKYEKNRVKSFDKVVKVSNIDVSLGYDIVSIKDENNGNPIYIEVKSYSNDRIYITRNEIATSKKIKEDYYIYMVNMNRINEDEYIPEVIQNPYENLIMNDMIEKQTEILSIQIKRNEN